MGGEAEKIEEKQAAKDGSSDLAASPAPTPAELALDGVIQQCKRAGKAPDAIAAIEAALLDDPANGRLHWRLGEVYR